MRVSLNWLNEYIDLSDLSAEELADKLDLAGTEVENIFVEGLGLDKVVVGQIKKIKKHPQADRLVLCDTSTGDSTVQIVCGAKNMKEGDKVALALPGCCLPGGVEIKQAKIRGEKSSGMLASVVELGLGEDASGIMILNKKLKIGEALNKELGLEDTILELEITPNRPDLMSIIGIAREIGAILGRQHNIKPIDIKEAKKEVEDIVSVKIKDPDLCPRYIGKVITDVVVGESPNWMKRRLIAAGTRPINNIVDITNYVLFETGQPLHAFDYNLLEGGQIIVRRANANEKIETLDEVKRSLFENNLVIADAKKAVALGGVMGGANSEVTDSTKVVLLEAAYFNPQNIGHTSRNMGLISESSMRFERGVDPNNTDYAASRAAQLMQEIAGGNVLKGGVDKYPKKINPNKIKLRPSRANIVLGLNLKPKQMVDMLSGLELKVISGKDTLKVQTPTFRPDLEREIDLIEEIGRLFDYNNLNSTLPASHQVGRVTDLDILQQKLRNQLVGYGLKEALTYSFIDPVSLKELQKDEQNAVALRNPISEEQSVLRTSLLPGLLNSLLFNVARKQENVQLFEIGTVFRPSKGLPKERGRLGVIISGSWTDLSWYSKGKAIDFYDGKGLVEAIIGGLKIPQSLVFEPLKHKLFHPQKSYNLLLGEKKLGYIGEIHPNFAQNKDIKNTVYFEIDLFVLSEFKESEVAFQGIPPYPGITLDAALLVDKKIKNQEIVRSIVEMGHDLLADVRLFDVYVGKGVGPDKKSMAYSLTYQSMERTLELKEVQKIHDSIIENLKDDLGAEIR